VKLAIREDAALLAGRACGECKVCCIVPGIDTREAQKDTNVACRHLCEAGCGIYDSRPGACRTFHCAWRQLEALDDKWRPDRSGVLTQQVTLEGKPGLCLTLFEAPLKTARQAWFVDFVAAALREGTPLLLALAGPRGAESAKTLLDGGEIGQAARRSRFRLRHMLEAAVKELMARPPTPLPLANRGNDVSGP
jgi:Fe-S-cluster containining protein